MENIQWEKINATNFNIFIRDLSQSLRVNLKHMVEDLSVEHKKQVINKHLPKHKKTVIKKKDLIIQEQNKLREEKIINEDLSTIEFLFNNLTDTNIYNNFEKLKTEKGKQLYKFRLLSHFMREQKKKDKKKDYIPHILNLYFNLKYGDHSFLQEIEEYKKTSLKLEKLLETCDYKTFMMRDLGHLLPPLNFWDKGEIQFDEWQKDIILKIKQKESVLVRAPTSSGKTFIAMSTGIIYNKILYVCPAKPVAYQIGANFIKMGYRVHYLVENMGHLSYDSNKNIFIGTPDIIEKYIYKIYTDFDYAVFDEIHNIDDDKTGKSYENIIKLLPCNFVALSATIENIDYLKSMLSKVHPEKRIHLVEYNHRFINQQRWVYRGNKLHKVHPIVCLDTSNFDSLKFISFTPNDCISLYEKLEEIFEDDEEIEPMIELLSPDNYLKQDKMLTLDDTKEYEIFLKQELKKLYLIKPKEVQEVIHTFKDERTIEKSNPDALDDILPFLNQCKKQDLLPLLYFHTEENISREIFMKIYEELHNEEKLNYPFHYTILEKKNDIYQAYIEKRKNYSENIKIKTKDAVTEKNEKMNRFEREYRDRYISEVHEYYQNCIKKCIGTENEKHKIMNLTKERDEFLENPDFREQDIYKKHPAYCFTRKDPMSGNEIRDIRREIKKSTGLTIEYENSVFQLLKRGIGLYIKSMPDEYNWILQKLMSQKKLGIIISDKTLCLGIDLPFRSVALSGYKNPYYTCSDYLQMSGRAGRRGHDNQGNIIFHKINNPIELMKGDLPKLTGSDRNIYNGYSSLNQLNKNINMKNMGWSIHPDSIYKHDNTIEYPMKLNKLRWYLRYNQNVDEFMKKLNTIEKELFMTEENKREYVFLELILNNLFEFKNENQLYQDILKKNKIDKDMIYSLKDIIEIGEVTKDICNSLDNSYRITKMISSNIFMKYRTVVYKYRGLTEG